MNRNYFPFSPATSFGGDGKLFRGINGLFFKAEIYLNLLPYSPESKLIYYAFWYLEVWTGKESGCECLVLCLLEISVVPAGDINE